MAAVPRERSRASPSTWSYLGGVTEHPQLDRCRVRLDPVGLNLIHSGGAPSNPRLAAVRKCDECAGQQDVKSPLCSYSYVSLRVSWL